VTNAKFARHFCRAFIVAKKNDLDIRMQKRPTLQRVALNDRNVITEWLGGSKKCQHVSLSGLNEKELHI
jgi:hypothetical protein